MTDIAAEQVEAAPLSGAPHVRLAEQAIRDPAVIDEIDALLKWCKENGSRLGFFAALYWNVATGIGKAVQEGRFENPDLIDHLDDVFFRRYKEAIDLFREEPPGSPPSASWLASFTATRKRRFIVVQHLLLGANAHINLDLAVAVAEAVPADRMAGFRADYETVNEVFADVIHTMVGNISRFSRVLMWVGRISGRGEDQIIGFSLKTARDGAWDAAVGLAAMTPEQRGLEIAARDADVAAVARVIIEPGWLVGLFVELIRRFEKRRVKPIIDDLLSHGAHVMTGPAPALPNATVPKKVAILGGGQAALTVALQLTDPANPHHADYDVTIYQLGWRLGGKGATGRPVDEPWAANRIEEHGLHTWFGFYDNSFRQMRGVFTELAKPPGSPLATFDDAFEGVDEMIFVEEIAGLPEIWTLKNPTNSEHPGVGGMLLNPWAYVQMAIEMLLDQFTAANMPFANVTTPLLQQVQTTFERLAAERKQSTEGVSLATPADILRSTDQIVSAIRRHVDTTGDVPELPILQLLDDTRKSVEADAGDNAFGLWSPPCGGSIHYSVVTWQLSLFMDAFWTAVGTNIETTAKNTERHLWIEANLGYACITGAMCDGVIDHGFDVINDIDFRHWIKKHQYADGGVLQRSPILEAVYTASFAYPSGNQTRGPGDEWPPAEDMEAGSALRGLVRTALTYKGSFAYRFKFGTADTCFAPIYELLTTKRGVKVQFFNRVESLDLDSTGTSIGTINIAVQAEVAAAQVALGGYSPLIDVHGLSCWPASPLWEQLDGGTVFDAENADFENPTAQVRASETPLSLHAGTDFDIVVLGIPVADHQNIASSLTAASPGWLESFQNVKTVRTQALQIWMTNSGHDLGLPAVDHATATWLYDAASPLNVLGDFSELLDIEWWPAANAPQFLGYLCSTMPDDPGGDPTAPFPDQTAADLLVRANAVTLLQNGLPTILPTTRVGPAFDWSLLFDPRPTPGLGPARLDAQYHRANITPSERYVLSLTNSSQYRLPAHDPAHFPNLYLAGDWTQCTLNAGCMEAATISGMLCANAIDGHPARLDIVGVDF